MKSRAILFVKDLHRMRAFYQRTFGMEAVDEADDHCVLSSEVLMLTLVVVPRQVAAEIVVADPPVRREHVPIKLAFVVPDIETLRPVVADLGGVIDPPSTAWEYRGDLHADAVDPEGNVIELMQPLSRG